MRFARRLVLCLVPLALLGAGGVPCNSLPQLAAFGSGSAGLHGVPLLAGNMLPDIAGSAFRFEVSGGFPNAPGVLVLSRQEAATWSPTYQTTLYTSPWTVLVPFRCDSTGSAVIAPTPTTHPIADLCGLDFVAHAVAFDFTAPGGGAWSQGLRVRFGALPPALR